MEDYFFKIGKSKFEEKLYEEAIFHYSLALDINPIPIVKLTCKNLPYHFQIR